MTRPARNPYRPAHLTRLFMVANLEGADSADAWHYFHGLAQAKTHHVIGHHLHLAAACAAAYVRHGGLVEDTRTALHHIRRRWFPTPNLAAE